MMGGGRDYSISHKLTLLNLLVSGTALLLACALFFVYDFFSFRKTLIRNLSIQAQIIGSNSTAAIVFDDTESAENTLSALRSSPNISSAAIYTLDGRRFASYLRDAGGADMDLMDLPSIPNGQREAQVIGWNAIVLARSVLLQGKPMGIVGIRFDMVETVTRLRSYALIVAAALGASLLAAFLISSRARRAISEPIVHLASIAVTVSRDRDYSVRAIRPHEPGEMATLVEAFNGMLDQIQQRDQALHNAQDGLERRVRDRTAQLANANKELESFSYSVSHDLRAPIRHIDGFAMILMQKCGSQLDPEAQQYLNRIRDRANHMGHLIDDLLNMARIGRQELARMPTDLDAIVQGAIRDLKPEYEERHIEWRTEHLPSVDCDPGLMKVVFNNLLSNAVKYTRRTQGAVIEVGQKVEDGKTVIFVRDNGAGFEQKYSSKLFGVFQRLHRAEDFEGTGVGLATVRRIVQKHGGHIWAHGKIDQGATFLFTLDSATHDSGNPADPVTVQEKYA